MSVKEKIDELSQHWKTVHIICNPERAKFVVQNFPKYKDVDWHFRAKGESLEEALDKALEEHVNGK